MMAASVGFAADTDPYVENATKRIEEARYDEALEILSEGLSRPYVDDMDNEAGRYLTTTFMHYVETRLDEQFLSGYLTWKGYRN